MPHLLDVLHPHLGRHLPAQRGDARGVQPRRDALHGRADGRPVEVGFSLMAAPAYAAAAATDDDDDDDKGGDDDNGGNGVGSGSGGGGGGNGGGGNGGGRKGVSAVLPESKGSECSTPGPSSSSSSSSSKQGSGCSTRGMGKGVGTVRPAEKRGSERISESRQPPRGVHP